MVEADNSGSLKLIIVAIGGTAAIVALVIALQGLYLAYEQHVDEEKNIDVVAQELVTVRAQQNMELSTYHWADKEKGLVAIPVSRAMEAYVQDSKSEKTDKKEPVNAKK